MRAAWARSSTATRWAARSNPAALILSCTAVGVQTDESGNPTVETVDAFGDPTSVENALGNTTIYDRNDNGQVTEMIQPSVANGYLTVVNPTTNYTYDSTTGMLTGEDNPDGSKQFWTYATYTTSGGSYVVPTETGEGIDDLPPGVQPPIDLIVAFNSGTGTSTYTYSPSLSSSGVAVYEDAYYDYYSAAVSGTVVSWSLDGGATINTGFLPAGTLPVQTMSEVYAYSYDVDDSGDGPADVLTVTHVGNVGTGSPETQYTYTTSSDNPNDSPLGLPLTMTDPDGNTTDYVYNSQGLVTEIALPSDTSATSTPLYVAATYVYYGYNTADDLTSMSNPVPAGTTLSSANTTYYEYDGLDRQVNETDPANSSSQSPQSKVSYDAMGNVIQESDLQAIVDSDSSEIWETTTYSYNSLEELTGVSAPGPNNSGSNAVTTYTYTPTGQTYQVTDADGGITTYAYDGIGEQTGVSLPDPATGYAGGQTTVDTYDAIGRLLSETVYPTAYDASETSGGEITSYHYTFGSASDPGMTVKTDLPNGGSTTEVDNTDEQPVSETDPLGNVTTNSYDTLGRPLQVMNTLGALVGPIYDADGNVVSDTNLVNGYLTNYTYNARGELVQTTGRYPDPQDAVPAAPSDDWEETDPISVTIPQVSSSSSPPPPTTTYSYSTTDGDTLTWTFDVVEGQSYEIDANWDYESGDGPESPTTPR